MNLSLGIDIGSSSTKAAALDEHGTLLGTLQVHADDPRTSAYGVLGRFLDQQGASFDDVEKIVLTGLFVQRAGKRKQRSSVFIRIVLGLRGCAAGNHPVLHSGM
mgnify:CR=1 FL=1